MPNTHRFTQLDVFSNQPLSGNPLAIVHDAADLDDHKMAALARWTNLSETAFLLPPTSADADYRVRIFTPVDELPFAGHPTLGSCHAWLAAGGRPRDAGIVIQQCEIGLVRIRRSGAQLAFAAPPLRRSGTVDAELAARITRALGVAPADIRAIQWADNGPPWIGVLLHSAEAVLAIKPNLPALGGQPIGVVGPYPAASECAFELRAFTRGGYEDPVTGSLNASLAQWLIDAGLAPPRYIASQGTVLRRKGRVFVERIGADTWIGGEVCPVVSGTITL